MSTTAHSPHSTTNPNISEIEDFSPLPCAAELCADGSPGGKDRPRRNAVCLERPDMEALLGEGEAHETQTDSDKPADKGKGKEELDDWILEEKGYDVQSLGKALQFLKDDVASEEAKDDGDEDQDGDEAEYEDEYESEDDGCTFCKGTGSSTCAAGPSRFAASG